MKKVKLFKDGRGQSVRLPKEFWFDGDHVLIKQVGASVVLTPIQTPWAPLIESLELFSDDFMESRDQPAPERR